MMIIIMINVVMSVVIMLIKITVSIASIGTMWDHSDFTQHLGSAVTLIFTIFAYILGIAVVC